MQVKGSIISAIHEARNGSRIVAGAVIFFFSWMNVAPAVEAAMKEQVTRAPVMTQSAPLQADPASSLQTLLNDKLGAIARKAAAARAKKQKADYGAERQALKDLQENLKEQDKKTLQGFQEDLAHIEKYKLPDAIKQRHDAAQAKFEKEAANVSAQLTAIRAADDKTLPTLALQLLARLDGFKAARVKTFDPKNLPFKVADGKIRKPKTSKKDLQDVIDVHIKLSGAAEFSPEQRMLEVSQLEAKQIQVAATRGEIYHPPRDSIQIASSGSLGGLLAVSTYLPPTVGDLAQTEDVQITHDIQTLAAQLNSNPVQIYTWVRNNIEFVPTYGSIQGSEATFQTLRGNAFDTASLLIGLLRASKIPARYVYGTIDVPINQAMNWLGVSSPYVALQLLGQGGIPSMGLAQGGTIVAVQLETVWVEAWVDVPPSRGAKNLGPQTWVPLDASYKQYTYSSGMALSTNVAFDPAGFISSVQQGQVQDSDGSVQSFNQSNLEGQLTQFQNAMNSYVDQQSNSPTIGDVIGAKRIIAVALPTLPSGLPYKIVQASSGFSVLPDALRATFQFNLYASVEDRSDDSPLWSETLSLPSVATKRITLSFDPASSSDAQALSSYLPPIDQSGSYDTSKMPTSLPGYLINVVANLKVDGQTVQSAGPFALGSQLATRKSITRLQGGLQSGDDEPIAGEFYSVGLNVQATNSARLQESLTALGAIQAQLSQHQFDGIGKDDVFGRLMDLMAQTYWTQLDTQIWASNRLSRGQVVIQPSFGDFHTEIQPVFSYGIAQKVRLVGFTINIESANFSVVADDGTQATQVALTRLIGTQESTLEHQIPDLLFTNSGSEGDAVSAVKALQIANLQGQKIFQVTAANIDAVLPQLAVSEQVKEDVENAVNAGMVATVHQSNVTVGAWTGAGYVLIDPATGSGAYKISGGANGGGLIIFTFLVLAIIMFALLFAGDWVPLALVTVDYLEFAKGVKEIAASKNSPEEKYKELKGLEFITACSVILSLLGVKYFDKVPEAALTILFGEAFVFELHQMFI